MMGGTVGIGGGPNEAMTSISGLLLQLELLGLGGLSSLRETSTLDTLILLLGTEHTLSGDERVLPRGSASALEEPVMVAATETATNTNISPEGEVQSQKTAGEKCGSTRQ